MESPRVCPLDERVGWPDTGDPNQRHSPTRVKQKQVERQEPRRQCPEHWDTPFATSDALQGRPKIVQDFGVFELALDSAGTEPGPLSKDHHAQTPFSSVISVT